MKSTNRLISLFAAILTTATMQAEVVYEPMIVESGFNRDCIAETGYIGYDDGCAWSPLYDLTTSNKHTSCFGTRSVIAEKNTNKGFTEEDYAKTVAGGWPDDNGNPDDRIVRCSTEYLADAYKNSTFANVYWRLAPYDGPNVLTLRPGNPDSDTKGWHASGILTFQKIGCYDQLFFLMASLRQGSAVGTRKVTTVVHYTDGTTSNQEFFFAGLGGEVGQRVQITNIYEDYFKKNTAKDDNLAYVSVFPMDVNPNKLIESIEFTNNITNTSAIIFAVTGRTADMEIPNEEAATTSDIDKTSFQACWDAIENAASYRIDVAEDIDFQRILEDYNNLPVTGSTCQDIVDLVSNTDYYWRVRSVNADGGQSASSAPMRVMTAADPDKGEEIPYTDEESENIEANLAPYIGTKYTLAELDIHRTLYRDGYFNTICLPFDLNAAQIAVSPLVGAQVYEFVSAQKVNGQLNIEISGPIDHIDAGIPYLIKWAKTTPEIIGDEDGDGVGVLAFKNVNVVTNQGSTLGEGEVQFIGNIGIAQLVELDTNNLFLGENNTLYYPEGEDRLKGFRAYFQLSAGESPAPARFVFRQNTPTDIERTQYSEVSVQKLLRDGQIVIVRDGKKYSILGQDIE